MTSDSELPPAQEPDHSTTPHEVQVEERKLSLHDFLKTLVKVNGSDLHLQDGSVPMIRVDGRARFLDCLPLDAAQMQECIDQAVQDPEKRKILQTKGAVDVSYPVPDLGARFRVNAFHSRTKLAAVMRRIITKIPTFEELNLPALVEATADVHRGIVVVSGTTGCGKTTTLAAIIGKINRMRAERIITIEDPIEYQYDNIKSLISQVEVGTDSESYEYALREVVRQDPDTILIGEIRDTFSLSTALRAADTGHLVFTTIHANSAALTVERMASLFDPAQKDLQRQQLAGNLVAVICQRLAKRREGKGRVPAVEVMTASPLVRKYIGDGDFDKLKGTIGNKDAGGMSFDQHLAELFLKQVIDVNEAKRLASNVDALNLLLRGIGTSDARIR